MTTPPMIVKLGATQVRQTPRMRTQAQIVEESSPEQEEEVHMATEYIVPQVEDALEVTIPKGAKFLVPLPPIDSRVKEDGDLLGYAPILKFIDYNLGDSKTYPQFWPDQYLMVHRNPRTGANEFVPMEHVHILEQSGLLNFLKIPHFGRGTEVNAMVCVILSCVHGGYLWLGNRVDLMSI